MRRRVVGWRRWDEMVALHYAMWLMRENRIESSLQYSEQEGIM
jgi:hypothetical protein